LIDGLAGIALAAGLGTRLQPLTALRPKALCPLGQNTLLDHALERLRDVGLCGPSDVAVNAHHGTAEVVAAVDGRATVSVEPVLLGSAGALDRLGGWLGDRPVVVTNADAYLAGDIGPLLHAWDGDALRLLVTYAPGRGDFGPWRFAGCSLMPARLRQRLTTRPSGLYEALWRDEVDGGRAELIPYAGTFIDCGTPMDYLRANLHQSGGQTVVGAGATVSGTAVRCVVWPDSVVGPDEHLVEVIRAGPYTVDPAVPIRPQTH
jgi:NDP-sugar pyrophosphorylase family protein